MKEQQQQHTARFFAVNSNNLNEHANFYIFAIRESTQSPAAEGGSCSSEARTFLKRGGTR